MIYYVKFQSSMSNTFWENWSYYNGSKAKPLSANNLKNNRPTANNNTSSDLSHYQEYIEGKKLWSDNASSRVPDLIFVLFELHKLKSLGLLNSIRWYITISFKVLSQILFEKIDLTIMDLKQNLCPLITSKIIDL